jgi:hypothetical protein
MFAVMLWLFVGVSLGGFYDIEILTTIVVMWVIKEFLKITV